MSQEPEAGAGSRIDFHREVRRGGTTYAISATSDQSDAVTVRIMGAAADSGEVTVEGTLHADVSDLGDVASLIQQVLGGLAQLHNLDVATNGEKSRKRPRSRGNGWPTRSHHPWTDELDQQLVDAWTAADPTDTVDDVLDQIANDMGRSPGGIKARLPRVGCDPETPGHMQEQPASSS